ncbi:MAG: hypothetical protein H6672_11030 [Anaerolineaceae bacterium]|nr:hypothetical protein [Anaerolineaceae bacterium]
MAFMIGKIRDTLIGLWPVLKGNIPKRGTVIVGVIAFLIGLVWSYAIQPTVFYDADPSSLQQSWQDEWVRLVADRYAAVTSNSVPSADFEAQIVRLLRAVDNPLGIVRGINRLELEPLAMQAQENAAIAPAPSLIGGILPFIVGPIVFVVVFVVGSLLYGFYINPLVVEPIRKRFRPKSAEDQKVRAELDAIHAARDMQKKLKEEAATAPASSDFGPPVARHVSIYFPGRSYDDSFSIEDEAKDDEFLGECGAVISETIGDDKVTAVEVWLFDKEDFVRTLTGVFVSDQANNDPALRSKLEPKGQLVAAKPGAVITLETNALRMQARIVDMGYGADAQLPPNSYFDKMTIELQAWRKDGTSVGAAMPAAVPAAVPAAAPSVPAFPPTMPPAAAPTMPPPATTPPAYSPPPTQAQPRPLTPPPLQYPPPATAPKTDDDPFGGTGDFTPIGS